MVVVNLYAFEKTASKPGVEFQDVIENIDIGGPSMVRSAAKNFQDVAIVTSPADYEAIAQEMKTSGGRFRSRPSGGWRRRHLPRQPRMTRRLHQHWSGLRRLSDGKFAIGGQAGFPGDTAAVVP